MYLRRIAHRRSPLTALRHCLVIGLAALPVFTGATPERAPDEAVRHTIATTRAAILERVDSIKADPRAARRVIREALVPRVDIHATARFVLGPQWQKTSPQDRERFRAAFTRHVTATYGLLLHRFADAAVGALKRLKLRTNTLRHDERTALVRTAFRLGDGEERKARMHLHARDGEWRLFDAQYRGFSLLRIWRAEIQGRLRGQSLDELIEALRQRHTKEPLPNPGIKK